MDDLVGEIRERVERGERVLVTTLTKRMAEDLADYLQEMGIKVHYLHSEVETLERIEILRDLRLGVYDVVVGINLLREGLDLPEVSLVAILDADKEGFLRSGAGADPDHRPRRAARRRHGDHVRRQDHRLDAAWPSTRPTAAAASRWPTTRSTASCRQSVVKACTTSPSGCERIAEDAAPYVVDAERAAEARAGRSGERPGAGDEERGGRAGVREGGGAARPDHRAAPDAPAAWTTGRSGSACATRSRPRPDEVVEALTARRLVRRIAPRSIPTRTRFAWTSSGNNPTPDDTPRTFGCCTRWPLGRALCSWSCSWPGSFWTLFVHTASGTSRGLSVDAVQGDADGRAQGDADTHHRGGVVELPPPAAAATPSPAPAPTAWCARS